MKWMAFCSSLAVPTLLAHVTLAQEFVVKRVADDSLVFTGALSDELAGDALLPEPVRFADFSALSEPGEYYLEVPGVGKSVSFRVGEDVYDGELATAMLGFYGSAPSRRAASSVLVVVSCCVVWLVLRPRCSS